MRYAFLSDIHSNLEALKAALDDLKREGAEDIFCLGDLVGYGADPNRVVDILKEMVERCVAGNHDHAAVDLTDTTYFNPAAREAALWTGRALTEANAGYLKSLPLTAAFEDFTLVHASPYDPQEWDYVLYMDQVKRSFDHFMTRVCLIGHSHRPFAAEMGPGGEIEMVDVSECRIKEDCRYLVNIGSVGQPRDGDPDAAYAIYDVDKKLLRVRRIPYDITAAQKKILDAGLPPSLAHRLALGR